MADTFPISGNIDPKTFPFLLVDLHRHGATGSLKVEGPTYPKALYFRAGRVLFGSSNDPSDQLGAILIENGKITQEQLDDVNTKVGPGNPLAKVLAESGYVNQRELGEAARVKVERILSDVVAYDDGHLRVRGRRAPEGGGRSQALHGEAAARRGAPHRRPRLRAAPPREPGHRPHRRPGLGVADLGDPDRGRSPCSSGWTGSARSRTPWPSPASTSSRRAKLACGLLFLGLVTKSEGTARPVAPDELDLGDTARGAFTPSAEDGQPVPDSPEENEAPFFTQDSPLATPASAFIEPTQSPELPSIPYPEPDRPAFGADGAESPPIEGLLADSDSPSPTLAMPPMESQPESDSEPTAFALAPPPDLASFAPVAAPTPPTTKELPALDGTESETVPGFRINVSPSIPPPAAGAEIQIGSLPGPSRDLDDAVTVPPSRPSKEDLAALDALLNPSGTAPPPSPPPSATLNPSASMRMRSPVPRPATSGQRWEPQFRGNTAGSSSGARRGRVPRRPVLPMVLAALAILGVSAALYYFLFRRPPASTSVTSGPKPTTPVPTATPRPATPAPLPSAAATPVPAPSAPASVVPTAPPATAPPVTAAPATSGGEARQLLRSGAFSEAARGFTSEVKRAGNRFSVQLLVACSGETVQKALDNVPSAELFILPVNYQGKSCYRALLGSLREPGPGHRRPRCRSPTTSDREEPPPRCLPRRRSSPDRAAPPDPAPRLRSLSFRRPLGRGHHHPHERPRRSRPTARGSKGRSSATRRTAGVFGLPRSLVQKVDQRSSAGRRSRPRRGAQPRAPRRRRPRGGAALRTPRPRPRSRVGAGPAAPSPRPSWPSAIARRARESAAQAVRLDDRDPAARALLGDALLALGERLRAEEEYRRSLRSVPIPRSSASSLAPSPAASRRRAQFRLRYDGGARASRWAWPC